MNRVSGNCNIPFYRCHPLFIVLPLPGACAAFSRFRLSSSGTRLRGMVVGMLGESLSGEERLAGILGL